MLPELPEGFFVLLYKDRCWRSVDVSDLAVYRKYSEIDTEFDGDWYLLQSTVSPFALSAAFKFLGPKRLVIAAMEWVEFSGFRIRAAALLSRRHHGKMVMRAPVFICDDCKHVIRRTLWPCDCRVGEQGSLQLVA